MAERPAVDLVLAIDVGGTSIKAEIVDPDTNTVVKGSAPTPYGNEALGAIVTLGNNLRGQLPEADRPRVAGAGLAVPGILDLAAGVAVNTVNVGWRKTQVVRPVSDGLGLPVRLSHDVTAGGYAEWKHGAGRGTDDLFVVIVGTGIAAVTVSGGRLVTGALSQAGELGHVIVRADGELCACGQYGCLETIASANAIARAYERESGTKVTGAADVRARLGSDAIADRVWADAVGALSRAILAASALFAPTRVVMGGGLADAGDQLIGALKTEMEVTWTVAAVPELVHAELGSRAGIVGAALRAWESVQP